MKSASKLTIVALTFLTLAASADAQSPREQLQQMVEQLQKTPTDNALRERIIKLGMEIKPAPAIPEEANRAFVKGNVFQKEAKDASGYDLAISAYREALRVAPWWGDAYYNLAVALESANKFDEAIASIKFFMVSVSGGSAEAREAQNRMYAIEAKNELANIPQARVPTEQEKDEALIKSLNGVRFDCPNRNWISGTTQLSEAWLVINGSQLTEWTKVIRADPDLARANPSSYGLGTVHPTSSPIVGALARGETYNVGRNYKITSDRIVIEHVGMVPVTCSRH
jgi:tetratricopeptide (TPR) repeat protein